MHIIKSPKDFWSGLIFIAAGSFIAIYGYTHYAYGSALRMGPGYFPTWLGTLTTILGLLVFVRSFFLNGPPVPQFNWRPILFIIIGCVIYGYILKPVGLLIATVILTTVSAFGGHEFKWKEAVWLSLAMAIMSWVIFVYALKLPFPLWPEAFQ